MDRRSGKKKTGRPTLSFYTKQDYKEITHKLPEIIENATLEADEVVEPTVHERKAVRKAIFDWIRAKGRIIYGGTALNEAIKKKNPEDAFYNESNQKDIEFYTPTPRPDFVDLCLTLHRAGFKHVNVSGAQHEGTYSLFANFQLYCDCTYVPTYIYNRIQTIEIDGIQYVHPHFALIDQLRIFCQPLTTAEFRWEKTFNRMYLLLKHYPFVYDDSELHITKPKPVIAEMIDSITRKLLPDKESSCRASCLVSGYLAYNFFVKHAASDRDVDQPSRTVIGSQDMKSRLVPVPFLDLVSVNYAENCKDIYKYLKKIAPDPDKISWKEFHPFFNILGSSIQFYYEGRTVVRVWNSEGICLPKIGTRSGVTYVTYTYILMFMLGVKFRAFIEKNTTAFDDYKVLISNLVVVRNYYLNRREMSVLESSVFQEFRVSCVGKTVNFKREGAMLTHEKYLKNKHKWRFEPTAFLDEAGKFKLNYDPAKYRHPNISGNEIVNARYYHADVDDLKPEVLEDLEEESGDESGDEPESTSGGSLVEIVNPKEEPVMQGGETSSLETESIDEILSVLNDE